MAQISGNLTKPDGTPIAGAVITFTSSINSYDVVRRVQVSATTGSNGSYSATVAIGVYAVSIAYTSGLITPVGVIVVTLDSGDATLNDYLLKNYDASYVTDVLTRLAQPGGVGLVNGALNKAMNLNDLADKVAARVNLDVYNKEEVDAAIEAGGGGSAGLLMRKSANLSDVEDVEEARDNLDVYSKEETDDAIAAGGGGDLSGLMVKTANLSDVADKIASRTNLEVFSKDEVEALIPAPVNISGKMDKTANLSDVQSVATARLSLDVYSKEETAALIPAPVDVSGKMDKTANLNDLSDKATARTNLSVYSKTEVDSKIPVVPDVSVFSRKDQNLADLTDKTAARTSLNVYSKDEIGTLSGGFMNVIGTFVGGVTLTSFHTLITDGKRVYQWDGAYNKVVPANSTPETTGGYGAGAWSVVGDVQLRSQMAAVDGFRYIGQVATYAALKTLVPSYEGQHVLLESFKDKSGIDGWAALSRPPDGHGQFVAINKAGVEDGGSIASVNDNWHWRRLIQGPYMPEMFGADSSGKFDSADAIINAMAAARLAGIDAVRGDGTYLVSKNIMMYPGFHPRDDGLLPRNGFDLYLNNLIADSTTWNAVPDDWWNAIPVFSASTGCEGLRITVGEFDGGGKASFFSTKGGSLGTSVIEVRYARNYIIVFRNYMDVAGQGTMNFIRGGNWQDGYQGILLGAGVGGANSECYDINVNWIANNRFGGVMLQDRSQYTKVTSGTLDFNGKWMSALTLTNISADHGFDVVYGNPVTNGTITRYAMSSIMNNDRNKILLVAETADKMNGTSDFVVGDTITYGDWSATIAAIEVCSNQTYNYFDLVICNRSGDFSKCTAICNYIGGWKGHNKFTNVVICNNSSETVGAIDFKGMGITGGADSAFMFWRHLYGDTPWAGFYNNNMTINIPLEMGDNPLWGRKVTLNLAVGTPTTVMSFSPASNDLYPKSYAVSVESSQAAQWAHAFVRVGANGIIVRQVAGMDLVTLSAEDNSFDLVAQLTGSEALITVSSLRSM